MASTLALPPTDESQPLSPLVPAEGGDERRRLEDGCC